MTRWQWLWQLFLLQIAVSQGYQQHQQFRQSGSVISQIKRGASGSTLGFNPSLLSPINSRCVIKYRTQEGLTNQLMSFVQGVRVAKSLNSSLLLPSKFLTRTYLPPPSPSKNSNSHQDMKTLNSSVTEWEFSDIFNILKLQTKFSARYDVTLLEESEITDHRIHLFHQFAKYTSMNETIGDLRDYLQVQNVILDVGPLYLRMIDTNCSNQKEISDILHLLLDCLAEPLAELITSLQSSLEMNYNAVHLRIEPDALDRWPGTRTVAGNWEKILLGQKFTPSVPLYIACGGCLTSSSRFSYILNKKTFFNRLSTSLKRVFLRYSASVHAMALVDLKMLIGAKRFAGSSYSAFSHLVVSERLRQKMTTNLCVFLPQPTSFTGSLQTQFGRITPDVTCSQLPQIQSTLNSAAIRDIIDGIPALFKAMNVENSPFNSLIYLLSYQPAAYSLPLVYTYLGIPLGDKWQIYSKVHEMFDKPGKRNIIICALETAIGAPISRPMRILLVLHNTMMQGASLMAFYLGKMYQERLGIEINFFTPTHSRGGLEVLIRNHGMKIQVGKRLTSVNMMRYNAVYLNTIVSWYHEYFPKYIGLYRKMCILYVHESMREEIFKIYPSSEEVMHSAKALVFVTPRSQAVYQDLIDQRKNSNHFVVGNSLSPQMIFSSQQKSETTEKRVQLGIKPSDLLFVISGDVYPNRNQAVFIEASIRLLDYLNQSYPPSPSAPPSSDLTPDQVFFLVIGFTEITQYVKDIYQRVQESPYQKQFILRDKMPHQTSLEYMAAGDVYVSLALKESFGLALLEAMTMGIPVIVAKLDGVPDVIYQEALDVDPTSPESVYEAMRVMLSPETRTLHSSYAQIRSEYFQQQFFLVRHLDVLRRVLWLPSS
jgi:glycosyltransferase involved in cell wall biosynthesis